jgi:GMP reductase
MLKIDSNYLKFDFRDISIVPEIISNINHRAHINSFELPLISSPMDSVLSIKAKKRFNKNFIYQLLDTISVCLPRNYELTDNLELNTNSRYYFKSISLDTFELIKTDIIEFNKEINNSENILIDIANGHIEKLVELSKLFISNFPDKKLMIGNIANPETYKIYADIGVHYVRIGIGAGSACLTSANSSVHYPMASLIFDTYQIKKSKNYQTKIVADGGFSNFDDIIKAIVLGADYVMIGSLLNKALESDSYPYLFKIFKIKNYFLAKFLFEHKFPLYKKHIGMSTKYIQKIWGNKNLKTSEGIVRWNKVQFLYSKWINNFNSYLKTAMSYTNSKTIEEFRENTKFIFITNHSYNRFNK